MRMKGPGIGESAGAFVCSCFGYDIYWDRAAKAVAAIKEWPKTVGW